jgi:RHS repeat-associated protein
VTLRSATGRETRYSVERLPTGDRRRVIRTPSGAETTIQLRTDGAEVVTEPDGTTTTMTLAPDPRWGMAAPVVASEVVATPSGLIGTKTVTRSVQLTDDRNPFSLGILSQTTEVNGRRFEARYDGTTRELTATSAAGRVSTTGLDSRGYVVRRESGDDLDPVTLEYDARGRITEIAQGTEARSFTYDDKGRISSNRNAAGHVTTYTYDAADRPVGLVSPSGRAYGYAYDRNGKRTVIRMPSGAVHALAWTPLDQAATYTPPGGGAYSWSFGLDRRVERTTLPTGRALDQTYDAGGRLTGVALEGASLAFGYEGTTGRVRTLSRTPPAPGSAETLALTYDGQLITSVESTGSATGRYALTHDSNFFVTGSTLTSGTDTVTTALARDDDGLLTGYGPFTLGRAGPQGRLSSIGDDTLDEQLTFDAGGRPASRAHKVGGDEVYRIQLTYDNAGKAVGKTETTLGTERAYTYSYDADGRLTGVKLDGSTVEAYAYDANGNRVSRTVGGSTQTATYDAQDRIQQQGGVTYAFDADGFATARGADTFQYSALGELLRATVGGQTVTYAYDGHGRRVARTDGTGTHQYLYGDPATPHLVTASRAPTGGLTTYYYDDAGLLFALKRGASWYYVATDQVGTPRVVVDAAGVAVKELEHDAFGNILSDSNPAFDLPIGFAGGLVDEVTGLVRFGFRDYDPAIGSWLARDPALYAGGQTNLYAYVGADPVGRRDPSGLGEPGPFEQALTTIQDAYNTTMDALDFTSEVADAVEEGNLTGLVKDKALDDAKDAIAPGATEEVKRLAENTEKTTTEAVQPWYSVFERLWDKCSNALAGGGDSSQQSSSESSNLNAVSGLEPLDLRKARLNQVYRAQGLGY